MLSLRPQDVVFAGQIIPLRRSRNAQRKRALPSRVCLAYKVQGREVIEADGSNATEPLPVVKTKNRGILIPSCSNRPVISKQVNCTPWSVLKISGFEIPRVCSRAWRQKPVSKVIEIRQAKTYRLNQSITAIRYFFSPGSCLTGRQTYVRQMG
jgi:hypothetical protein